jgi:hypothetical protein
VPSLESSIALSDVARCLGEHRRSLDVLAEAEMRSGDLAGPFRAAIARARAETLLALDRRDEAAAVVGDGLAAAEQAVGVSDRARLLVLGARTGTLAPEDSAGALPESRGLLQRLGVIAVPCR